MPTLTIEEINQSFPDNRYLLKMIHNPDLWAKHKINPLPQPDRVRFDENVKVNIPKSIKDNKGIYMFILEPNHPFQPNIKHVLYIGRVREGKSRFSFFKRFDEYKRLIGNVNGSLNKVLLTNLWPNHTFVYFYSLNQLSDDQISNLEKKLYKSILPPLNAEIGGRTEQTRNLY